MNKISALIKISRPLNIFQSSIAVLITAALFHNPPQLSTLIYTFFIVGTYLSAGNAINCYLRIYSNISVIILGINLLLLILYTPIIKPTVFLGNIVVSYLLGSTFLFCAEIFGNITLGIIPALLAFSFNLARELIKDIEDESGDKQNNIKTLS
jgi:4-hydroxybenzoate polyprenyltransferase